MDQPGRDVSGISPDLTEAIFQMQGTRRSAHWKRLVPGRSNEHGQSRSSVGSASSGSSVRIQATSAHRSHGIPPGLHRSSDHWIHHRGNSIPRIGPWI